MSEPFEFDAASGVLTVHGELTVYEVVAAKAALENAVVLDSLEAIDLSAVTTLDTAGLQLLFQAKRMYRPEQAPLRLVNHSAKVQSVLALMGLTEQLDIIALQEAKE
ncbi:MAG: STAS domain-containing protein [Natronospirillum sp.]